MEEREELRAFGFATHRQVDKNVHSPYFAQTSLNPRCS